jgi:hypothetical protein
MDMQLIYLYYSKLGYKVTKLPTWIQDNLALLSYFFALECVITGSSFCLELHCFGDLWFGRVGVRVRERVGARVREG